MATCNVCGRKLSLTEAVGEDICRSCARERKQLREEQVRHFEDLCARLRTGEDAAKKEAIDFLHKVTVNEKDTTVWRQRIFSSFVDWLTEDGALSVLDERAAQSFADQLGLRSPSGALQVEQTTLAQLQMGRAAAGRLPAIDSRLLMKPWRDEVVHWQAENADLMHIGRRYVRTYQGVSLPIGKSRVRYHVGMSSGRVVTTGFEVADYGSFLITSQRAIFMGRETVKVVPYSRLLDIKMFSDGMELFREDRVNPVPIRIHEGAELAAVIAHVSALQFLGEWVAPYTHVVTPPTPSTTPASETSELGELFGTISDVAKDIDNRLRPKGSDHE